MSFHLKPNLGLKPVDRPLGEQKEFSTTMTIGINDLPATSPHGSYFERDAKNLGFATDPNATRGTPTAHRDFCCNLE
jgi:hypothetical protein